MMTRQRAFIACLALLLMVSRQQQPPLAARGESLAAFDGRGIPAGGVAPPSHTPGMFGRRALPAGRLARLGATPDFHHGLLAASAMVAGAVALPEHIEETGLFAPGRIDVIAAGIRPFSPQYPLWTDGAAKRRWIQLPAGSTIDGSNARRWEFPIGTRLWKEFSFAGRRVETRFLWKATAARWLAGSYVWNAEGTSAALAAEDGVQGAVEVAPGRRHNIPSRGDCAACHGDALRPLGVNPLQLSNDRDPNAIHGEPLTPDMVTLQTLLDEQLLTGADAAWRTNPPRIAARDPATRTVLGYFSANCGGCHNGDGQITAQLPSFHYQDVLNGEAIVAQLIGRPSRWQAPGRSEDTLLIDPALPPASAVLLRMRSRRPSSQMPPLGTVVPDQAAVQAIERWIADEVTSRSSAARGLTPGAGVAVEFPHRGRLRHADTPGSDVRARVALWPDGKP